MNLRESRSFAGAACTWMLVLATACSTSNAAAPHDAGAQHDDSGDAGNDAGAPDASEESSGDSANPTTGSSIVILQLVGLMGTIGDISATFDPHYPSGLTCARTVSGPCTVDDCTAVDMQGAMLTGVSAGTLSLSGAKLPTTLMLHPGADDAYEEPLGGNPLFDTGNVFQVSASGDAFPAFSGQSAAAPAPVAITSPAVTMDAGGPTYSFDPAQPLTWTWTGGQTGTSVIFSMYTSSPDLTFTCTFDSTVGTGTIPQDVVAKFPAMPSTLQIVAATSATLTAGSQSVVFSLETGSQPSLAPQ